MKSRKLDDILSQLDTIYRDLKQLGVPKSTLDAVNAACDLVQLDLREAAYFEGEQKGLLQKKEVDKPA